MFTASSMAAARTLAGWRARFAFAPEWLQCLVLAAAWFGCTAWLRPLAIPDEGRYVGVAWEMLRSHDWLVPTLNGAPFFHKPPMFYWITAAAMQLFGPSVAVVRAAAFVAAVATTTGVFAFLSRWVGRREAWSAVAVLATMPLFYGAAQYANMDELVAGCVAGAILFGAHAMLLRQAGSPHRAALAASFVVMGLGVLSKGLLGVALPLLVLVAWGLVTRRLVKVIALMLWAPGWALFALVAMPWFLAVQAKYPDFGHYFIVVQHLQRFTASSFNNVQPWWFYIAVLLVFSLPWSPWLLFSKRRAERPASPEMPAVRSLMAVWLATVVVFFSVPSSKLVGYVLPALPPLACWIADAAWRWRAPRDNANSAGGALGKWRLATIALAGVTCLAGAVAAHFFQPKSRESLASEMREMRRPGEPVFFLDNFYYDVTFYARLETSVFVVDAWLPAELAKDSWRRELRDAQGFAHGPAAQRLLMPDELAPALCRNKTNWLIGPWPVASGRAWLAAEAPVFQKAATALWRIDGTRPSTRAALQCADDQAAAVMPPR